MFDSIFVYGKNVVGEALENRPDVVERIFLEKGKDFDKAWLNRILKLAEKNKIPKEVFSSADMGKDLKEAKHQGVLAKINLHNLCISFEYFLENLQIDKNTCLLILGELEDVQNVGSIIRSAAAFGVNGILVPEHNQAQINATVVKISAGAVFTVPTIRIGNVNQAIEKLKEKGFWVYGLDAEAEKTIYEEKYSEPTVFVVGNEGSGIREKTRKHCDLLLSIPISERCESLNASVSAAVALYEWRKQKLNG